MTSFDTAPLTARIAPYVERLYPDDRGEVLHALIGLAERYAAELPGREVAPPTQRTSCLITYGDGIRRRGEAPLHTLVGFLHDDVGDLRERCALAADVPWTSDDGFAVVDHRAVIRPGYLDDVAELAAKHAVMFDFVANQILEPGAWFLGLLAGGPDLRRLLRRERPLLRRIATPIRPRVTPLYDAFRRADGTKAWAWTTFREDQVDVDVRNRGPARSRRRTAGYLVRGASRTVGCDRHPLKETGTTCLHLPQTRRRYQAVAGARGRHRAEEPVAHRDQCPARRDIPLLREWPR